MAKNDWLDHSSIYSQQHNTFYRWIVYPVIILFLLLGLFLFFAKKEVAIRTTAQLIGAETEKIQVPIDAKILENKLHENQQVQKGDSLIIFDTEVLLNEQKQLEQENKAIEKQKKAAQTFIDSLTQERDLFESEDIYGYNNQLKSLVAENESNEYMSKQSIEITQKNLEMYQKNKECMSQQLNERQSQKNEWEQVRSAWNNNQQEVQGFATEIMAKYQAWQSQLSNTSEELNNQVRTTVLVEIEEQIAQLNKEIEQVQGELAKLVIPAISDNEINSYHKKAKQKIEQTVATTRQSLLELTNTQQKNTTALKALNEQIEQGTLKASIDGRIHLTEQVSGQKVVQKGTLLAEIYPILQDDYMTFTALLPTNEINRIEKGMNVHFKLDKNRETATIDGILTEISETSTTSEQGTFFTIKGELQLPSKFKNRYGLIGELFLIVGTKTYWQQIKEILLNKE